MIPKTSCHLLQASSQKHPKTIPTKTFQQKHSNSNSPTKTFQKNSWIPTNHPLHMGLSTPGCCHWTPGSRLERAAPCPAQCGEPRIPRVRQGRRAQVARGLGLVESNDKGLAGWIWWRVRNFWWLSVCSFRWVRKKRKNTELYLNHILYIQVSQHIHIISSYHTSIYGGPTDVCPWETIQLAPLCSVLLGLRLESSIKMYTVYTNTNPEVYRTMLLVLCSNNLTPLFSATACWCSRRAICARSISPFSWQEGTSAWGGWDSEHGGFQRKCEIV